MIIVDSRVKDGWYILTQWGLNLRPNILIKDINDVVWQWQNTELGHFNGNGTRIFSICRDTQNRISLIAQSYNDDYGADFAIWIDIQNNSIVYGNVWLNFQCDVYLMNNDDIVKLKNSLNLLKSKLIILYSRNQSDVEGNLNSLDNDTLKEILSDDKVNKHIKEVLPEVYKRHRNLKLLEKLEGDNDGN